MQDRAPRSPTTRRPTIKDVAARAGVAPGTVSNVLSGRRPVAEAARNAVLEAVEALRYRPNQLASGLRMRQTRTIGLVVPDLTNPFFAALVAQVETLAAREGYSTLLMSSHENQGEEIERIATLVARQIDGLMIAPTGDDIGRRLHAIVGRPPTLLLDRGFETQEFDSICADNAEATHAGGRYLFDLGHRDIALLATDERLENIRDRVSGFVRAARDAGMESRARIVFGGLTVDSCRGAIEQELRRADRPTAIFAVAYVATLGAIKAIRALEFDFPRDVSLLGFDDFEWMTAFRPYISTVEQDVPVMAERAWTTLWTRMQEATTAIVHEKILCKLQRRESTQPLRS